MVKNDTLGTINKTAIKNFAVYSRGKLIQDIKNKVALIGITESSIQEPLPISAGIFSFLILVCPNRIVLRVKQSNNVML